MAIKKHILISLSLGLILTLLITPVNGQVITISPDSGEKKYELPHPGILPDNPFLYCEKKYEIQ